MLQGGGYLGDYVLMEMHRESHSAGPLRHTERWLNGRMKEVTQGSTAGSRLQSSRWSQTVIATNSKGYLTVPSKPLREKLSIPEKGIQRGANSTHSKSFKTPLH
jgi:hypothetical protein